MKRDRVRLVLWMLALPTGANALWMLAGPWPWYVGLPAGVPDFGPYNEHFVRDIGCAFAVVAVAFGWAAERPRDRTPLVAMGAAFLCAHALLHVFDTARGFVGSEHWWIDLPGVYVPGGVSLALLLHLRAERSAGVSAMPSDGPPAP